jgi:hypothetical protein
MTRLSSRVTLRVPPKRDLSRSAHLRRSALPSLIVALTSIERSGPRTRGSRLVYFHRESIEPVRVSARTGFILPFIVLICLRAVSTAFRLWLKNFFRRYVLPATRHSPLTTSASEIFDELLN